MMNVLHDPNATPTRKDAMAASAAPYVHCKLSATAIVDVPDANYRPLEITILALPRGCQVAADGSIVHPDGTLASVEETRFEPAVPTPGLDATASEPAPLPQLESPLGVRLIVDNDDEPGAA